jgi:tetratricopeptide (TPR) repeat protein
MMKIRIFFLLLCGAALAGIAAGQGATCPENDADCRIKLYSEALKKNPKDIEAVYNLGVAFQLKGEHRMAIAAYDRYLASTDGNRKNIGSSYVNRAASHGALGNVDKTLADLSKAIELEPTNITLLIDRGRAYNALKRYDEAIMDLNQAIAADASSVAAHFARGNAHAARSNLDPAIADFSKVIQLDPSNHEAYYNRAVMYNNKQDFAKAVADLTKYLDFKRPEKNTVADAYLNRAIANYYNNNIDGAIADLTSAIETNPALVNAYRARSMIYREAGKVALAEADEKKATELSTPKKP